MLRGRPLAVNRHVDRPDHGITRNRHNDVCRSPEAISAPADPARRRLHRRRGPRVVRGHRATRGGRREQRSPRAHRAAHRPGGLWHRAPAAFRVRVWHISSRGWDPWTERPLPEVVRVAYPLERLAAMTPRPETNLL